MASDSRQAAPAVVLFDIDGTLIRRAGPHHRQALVEAVRVVTGLDTTTDHIPVQGMLDRDILTRMMKDAGATRLMIAASMPSVVREAQRIYVRNCPVLETKVCPGSRELLQQLLDRGIPVGLVTGNLTRIAWKKMQRARLRRFFRFGAFAEFGRSRGELVRIAIRYARRQGWISPQTLISLVGDHENDVRAARANGIRSIAVATGLSSMAGLATASPDVLVPDLRMLPLACLLEK
ncbi:MAG: haloacid dehalogenase-like hydrolase [Bryobacteraceae bacterium]|nr:HAD hydrolase-like protein [Bryobacterales bacterium]MEB2361515.1 HAD hydrolase-like protein [Bryobacterales bacterium]NUN01719.1 haloacid dehalogenase-like hydrolase [Bryobacteraceae bacterium]